MIASENLFSFYNYQFLKIQDKLLKYLLFNRKVCFCPNSTEEKIELILNEIKIN